MSSGRPGRMAHAVFRHTTFGATDLWWQEAGSGPSIVLLHAWPVDGRLFDEQLRASARGDLQARVIVPDLPGFGRSPYAGGQPPAYRTADLARLIGALIERLELRSPIIGGVAIGGTISAEIVAEAPHRFGGLVLIANKPGAAPRGAAEDREAQADRILASGSGGVAADIADAALGPAVTAMVRDRVRTMVAEADPRGVVALARAITDRPDLATLVPRPGSPVLIIAGCEDRISPLESVRALRGHVPGAQFLEVAGAGHLVPIEAPADVTAALAAFAMPPAAADSRESR